MCGRSPPNPNRKEETIMYPEYPEELKTLQPGDLFKVDFGDRRLSDIQQCYHKYVGIWMEIIEVVPEKWEGGSLAYRARALTKHNPGLPSNFQTSFEKKCQWRPGDDFMECRRVPNTPKASAAKQNLPNI